MVAVPPTANKEKIHTEFKQFYDLALKAVEEKYKAQLKAKDEQIELHRERSADIKGIAELL